MELPSISIITPTLNSEATVRRAILSVANQQYQEIEHLIIDGYSKDNTISIIRDYQERYGHIILIQEKDAGIYDAMNKGINLFKGDWLYFLGADDELYDENVLSDLHSLGAFSQDRVFFGNVYIQGDTKWAKDKTIYDGPFDLKKLLQKNICQQAIFYPSHIIKDIGYFNEEYEVTADWDYNLRCFAKQDFLYVDKTIAVFAGGGKSSQTEVDINFKEFVRNIISYFNLDPDDSKYYKPNSPFCNLLSHYKHILKTQLNPFTDNINEGISLFTAVKNRKEIFEDALKTWVKHKQIDEIIIVDWSSDKSLLSIINKYQNGKILLVRVKDQEKWVLSHAFNLAARLTTKDKILKIDADVKILPDFFKKHTLQPGKFLTGNWEKARNENETHLNGNAFLYREDFFRVNGYNEFFKTYGWDDTDFFSRLEAIGLERLCFDFDTLHHIEHKGTKDFKNQSELLKNISNKEWTHLKSLMNKYINKSNIEWLVRSNMPDFSIKIVDKNLIKCKQTSVTEDKLTPEIIQDVEINAIKERLHELGIELHSEIENQISKEEFIQLYNIYLSKDIFDSYNHLFSLIIKFSNTYYTSINRKNEDVNRLNAENLQKEQTIKSKDKLIQERDHVIDQKDQTILERYQEIREKEKLIQIKNQTIQHKEQDIQNKDQTIHRKEQDIQNKYQTIQQKKQEILVKNEIILKQQKTVEDGKNYAHSLQKQLTNVYCSYSWKPSKTTN
jgi:glycosyltransferase involved in cell wall biosynthesis